VGDQGRGRALAGARHHALALEDDDMLAHGAAAQVLPARCRTSAISRRSRQATRLGHAASGSAARRCAVTSATSSSVHGSCWPRWVDHRPAHAEAGAHHLVDVGDRGHVVAHEAVGLAQHRTLEPVEQEPFHLASQLHRRHAGVRQQRRRDRRRRAR